jgi:thiamine biosynthesis protein ThiS
MIIRLGYLIKIFKFIAQMKHFLLNGQSYYTNQNITLSDVIIYFNYNDSLLVLELNKFICNKNKWHNTLISNHDQIEIVTIVGGG